MELAESGGKEYVLKRTRRDSLGEARRDFLRSGTIAYGAAETSVAERYMNERMALAMPGVGAPYLGSFETGDGTGQVLVWEFDTARTLDDALRSRAPLAAIEAWQRGREQEERRDAELDVRRRKEVVRRVMKQLLAGLKRLDAAGIRSRLHRSARCLGPPHHCPDTSERRNLAQPGCPGDLRTPR